MTLYNGWTPSLSRDEIAANRAEALAAIEHDRRIDELELKIIEKEAFLLDYPQHTSLCSDVREWIERAKEQLAMMEMTAEEYHEELYRRRHHVGAMVAPYEQLCHD